MPVPRGLPSGRGVHINQWLGWIGKVAYGRFRDCQLLAPVLLPDTTSIFSPLLKLTSYCLWLPFAASPGVQWFDLALIYQFLPPKYCPDGGTLR